ncbi:hypothetical protein SLEP1_g40692 [Rubroshorea leprosula]|uniref:F-box protein n=1 Tax=Rubroshorea leprosula TaxID=152421 RepID=A0AAV5L4K7_9ROSI|nr:hypothetical protein SLEP1_g40692 [Rubroshorea leprosula]
MSDESETRNWLELPRELTVAILSRLGPVDILTSAQSVRIPPCGDLSTSTITATGPSVISRICASEPSIAAKAIWLISTSSTLLLITFLNVKLRHKGLCKAAKKLALVEELDISYCCSIALVEELDISYCCSISAAALIVVDRRCPHVKSFKYNKQDRYHYGFTNTYVSRDKTAKAIAQNMHELRHLHLFGNKLTNCGLEAILDGCPHLKSLDLRHCFNVSLQGICGKYVPNRSNIYGNPKILFKTTNFMMFTTNLLYMMMMMMMKMTHPNLLTVIQCLMGTMFANLSNQIVTTPMSPTIMSLLMNTCVTIDEF